jgi:mono/diheme cytochrome c family protein
MTRKLTALAGGLLAGLAISAALAACGEPAQTVATPAPKPAAAPAAPAPVGAPRPVAAPVGAAGAPTGDLVARGRVIFEKTAGGVGCAYCHGMDGKGSGPAGLKAAFIQGKTEADVKYAMRELPMMSTVKLTDDEVTAVVAYMQTLK